MSSDPEDIVFEGNDSGGLACSQFIRAVRKRAFELGKQDDLRWTAQFAATCLDHDALIWRTTLDMEIRNDWVRLEQALIAQYPRQGRDGVSWQTPEYPPEHYFTEFHVRGHASIPTPAAAPPTSSNTPAPSISIYTGRIRIESTFVSEPTYVSRLFNDYGCHGMTKNSSEALAVRFSTSPDLQELKADNPLASYDRLAVVWRRNRTFADLIGADGSSSGSSIAYFSVGEPAERAVWKVGRAGALSVHSPVVPDRLLDVMI